MTDADARIAPLPSRALVVVEGEGWRGFLQGLLTQDVEGLADGESRYAALLTPQGRLSFELFVHAEPGRAVLEVAAAKREALIERLTLYRLRAKVRIAPEAGEVFVVWGDGAAGGPGWRPDPRLAPLGFRAFGEAPPAVAGAQSGDAGDYDLHRRRLGVFDAVADPGEDKAYPIELNFDLLGGIDFKKGCFVGQETTSRMKRRGGVRSRAVPLLIEGAPAPGAEVLAGELRAGEVLSSGGGVALAVLRLDRALGQALTVDGRPATIAPAPWLAPVLEEAAAGWEPKAAAPI